MDDRGFSDENLKNLGIGLYPAILELKKELKRGEFDIDAAQGAGLLNLYLHGYAVFPWSDPVGSLLAAFRAASGVVRPGLGMARLPGNDSARA